MKLIIPSLIGIALLASCGDSGSKSGNDTMKSDSMKVSYFGDTITADGAIPVAELEAKMGDAASYNCKLEGTIESVCQKKGCWMELTINDTEALHVSFKDYKFFVPKDASGKKVIMEGVAKYDTVSVSMLKHLASDANKPQEEIDKITEPEYELFFEASGVMIKE